MRKSPKYAVNTTDLQSRGKRLDANLAACNGRVGFSFGVHVFLTPHFNCASYYILTARMDGREDGEKGSIKRRLLPAQCGRHSRPSFDNAFQDPYYRRWIERADSCQWAA